MTTPPNATPATAKLFFDQRIPIICFHGLQDSVVFPNILPVNFAPADPNIPSPYKDSFHVERTCLTNSPFVGKLPNTTPPNPPPAIYTYGSPAYYNYILKPLGIRSELYIDCDAQHGLRNADTTFKADYGTKYGTPDLVSLYIIGRAATFFKTIIGNRLQTSHRVFVECRNNRVTCDGVNDDENCDNNDNCSTHPH